MLNSEYKYLSIILLLSLCFAFSGSTSSLSVSAASLVGHDIANNKALATLPLSFHLLGTMLSGLPASLLMKRVGRRYGFIIGTGLGICQSVNQWCAQHQKEDDNQKNHGEQ